MPSRRSLQQLEIGLYIFIASLSMFFLGALAAYLIFRTGGFPGTTIAETARAPLSLPRAFWVSTALLVGGSVSLQMGLRTVRRERQTLFRRWLLSAFLCGLGFVIIQSVCVLSLLETHWQVRHYTRAWAFVFILVLLHTAHFLGGLVVLAWVTWKGLRGRFDHEYYSGVKLSAIYWHFLDVVWLLMLAVLLITL